MAEQIDVLLFGLGAIGSFYAFILSRSKRVRLSVCARSNYEAVKTNGLMIDSENHGQHTFRPFKVLRSPAEADMKYDYIVCANKAIDQAAVASLLTSVVDEERTTFVIVQNGVSNEDPFRAAFPRCSIISGVADRSGVFKIWVGATQVKPGIVHHFKSENTQFGLFPNPAVDAALEQQRLDDLVAVLVEGGTNIEVVPNVQIQKWEKVTWNAAWNSLTTLTDLDTQQWLASSEDAIPLSRNVMREMIDVAIASGVPLEHGLIDTLITRILGLQGLPTSMQTDCRMGRRMEVDIILGTPVKKARQLNVKIPTLETLYAILQAIDHRIASQHKQ